jgi:cysteine-rich repeat protein
LKNKTQKIIALLVAGFMLIPIAIADSSTSFKIDMATLNGGGGLKSSTTYKINDSTVNFVSGSVASSTSFKLDSGLINLEQLCGNGIVEFGEACDDGNILNGDSCSSVCVVTTPPTPTPTPTPGGGGGGGGGYGTTPVCTGSFCLTQTNPVPPAPAPTPAPTPVPTEEPEKPSELMEPGAGEPREIKIIAHPEKRVYQYNNYDTRAYIRFYSKDEQRTPLTIYLNSNNQGWFAFDTNKLNPGFYDIALKGQSHLTHIIRNAEISGETTTLDFTSSNAYFLIAGDVHSSKDDFINGLDISATVEKLYQSDIDADLNQDGIVNALDLSIVTGNLYKRGEKL